MNKCPASFCRRTSDEGAGDAVHLQSPRAHRSTSISEGRVEGGASRARLQGDGPHVAPHHAAGRRAHRGVQPDGGTRGQEQPAGQAGGALQPLVPRYASYTKTTPEKHSFKG